MKRIWVGFAASLFVPILILVLGGTGVLSDEPVKAEIARPANLQSVGDGKLTVDF